MKTDQEFIKALLEKAIENGWRAKYKNSEFKKLTGIMDDNVIEMECTFGTWYFSLYEIIFSHDFAKAIWGEDEMDATALQITFGKTLLTFVPLGEKFGEVNSRPAWKVHLQQMVLAENPINYLKKYGGVE